jgi:hypothetical protein
MVDCRDSYRCQYVPEIPHQASLDILRHCNSKAPGQQAQGPAGLRLTRSRTSALGPRRLCRLQTPACQHLVLGALRVCIAMPSSLYPLSMSVVVAGAGGTSALCVHSVSKRRTGRRKRGLTNDSGAARSSARWNSNTYLCKKL